MRNTILVLFTIGAAFAQGPPKEAVDITNAEVQEVLKNASPQAVDQQLKVVDMGKYNLAVGIIHRGPTKDGGPITGIAHDATTETYIITSGSGTLVTGGTMQIRSLSRRAAPPTKSSTAPALPGR
jgi:hypothetical protein